MASAGALYTVPATSVMVPAGGSARLQVRGMSLQPGSTIPLAPVSLAEPSMPPDNVRATLYYGIHWGYTETDPQQAVLAVWYAQSGTWHGDQHAAAEQIHSTAAGSPGVPSWSPSGRSALQLASSGQVTLSEISFAPSSLTPSVGSGTLTLTNASSQELLVYLPYGAIFGAGPGAVLVWAVGEVEQAVPTATSEEALPQPTDTVETVENTPTQPATATATAATPGGKKAPASPTPSPEVAQEASPTPQTPPGKKSAATETATSAPTDTSTPMPTDTATPEPTATAEATVAAAATVASTTSKPPAASQNAGADRPAAPAAPAAPANESNVGQNAAPVNSAPTGSKGPGNNQNNVQPPASPGGASTEAQAPAASEKAPETASEQAAPAQVAASGQDSKIAALAPAVTITTIPRPVGTSADAARDSAAIPPAVQTSGVTPPPAPVETGNPTAPAGSTGVPTTRATAVRTGTPAAATSPTSRPTNTTTLPAAESTVDTTPPGQNTPGADVVPTEAVPDIPTREPAPPDPTRLADIEPTPTPSVPVIVTDPGGADGGQGGVVVGSDSGAVAPSVNPRTGGGPSSLPLLLSVSSLVLVLSGLQLRRLAKKQHGDAPHASCR